MYTVSNQQGPINRLAAGACYALCRTLTDRPPADGIEY
jgi:hypothetical protein